MFTLTFYLDEANKEYEKVSATHYTVTASNGAKHITVFIYGGESLDYVIGSDGFEVCYVTNLDGRTIDKISV